jgi:hypothetical protein
MAYVSGANMDNCQLSSITGYCTGTGGITISNGAFDWGKQNGLYARSNGAIIISNSSFSHNGASGADLSTQQARAAAPITLTNTNANWNANSGVKVDTNNSIVTITNINAYHNQGSSYSDGNLLVSGSYGMISSVTITNPNLAYGNLSYGGNIGLAIDAVSTVSVSNVNASNNHQNLYLDTMMGTVTISGSHFDGCATCTGSSAQIAMYGASGPGKLLTISNTTFNDNNGNGLYIDTQNGPITLSNITASWNTAYGVELYLPHNTYPVVVSGTNTFNGNGYDGLYIQSKGNITVSNVTATHNLHAGMALTCGPMGDPCDGGTGVISVDHATLTYNGQYGMFINSRNQISMSYANVFFNGSVPFGDGIHLEIHSAAYKISIINSAIHGNAMSGIYVNKNGFAMQALILTNTSYFGNNTAGVAGVTNLMR